jgi:dephospho-CoA kinase
MSSTLNIGLTGGIGSGKSTCAAIFKELGVPIYNSDDEAKRLMISDESLMAGLIEIFGQAAYLSDGKLNRSHLSSQIFNNKKLLQQMNALVHPAVRADAQRWVSAHQNKPYVIQEAAILFETGAYKAFDKMILVTAEEELRIDRVMKRDNIDRASVLARISNQLPEQDKIGLADFIIYNDGSKGLITQIIEVHLDLQNLATLKRVRG